MLTAQDLNNNTTTSFTGRLTYSGTAGITGTSASFTLGQLTGVSVTPTVAGTGMTLIVTGSGKTGTSSFNVNPGAVDHFLISDISSPQTAGTAITGIMLTAQDLNNNTTTSFTGTVTYSGTAGITGTSASFTLGLLTGVSVTPTVAGTGMTFIVTGPGKTGTSTFTVNAGMATKLAYTTVPSTGTAGTAFSVTVQSQDANGNPSNLASATTITLSKATGGGTLSGMLTGSIGIGSSSVTIATPVYSKADMMTLTASASGGVTLTAITSGNIVFSAGAATQVIVETAADGSGTVVPAQDVNTGNSITVYAITRDASNNFVANIAVSWSLVGKTGGVANGDLAASGDTKSAIFTANYNGNAQIEAISGSLTQINSGTITVPVILIVTAPSAINLNVLVVGQTTTGYSVTSGSVVSNYANWSVSATDASGGTKTTNYGYMTTNADGSGSKLTDAFRIGKVSGNYYASNSPGLTYNGAGDGSLPFYVSQSVVSNDAAGLYTITITFIVSTP
jgi:hypothetical protein